MFSKQTNDIILEGLIEEISIKGREWFMARHEQLAQRPGSVFGPRRRQPAEEPSREQRLDAAMMGVLDAVAALNEFLDGMGESAKTLLAAGPEECEYEAGGQEMS